MIPKLSQGFTPDCSPKPGEVQWHRCACFGGASLSSEDSELLPADARRQHGTVATGHLDGTHSPQATPRLSGDWLLEMSPPRLVLTACGSCCGTRQPTALGLAVAGLWLGSLRRHIGLCIEAEAGMIAKSG